MNDTRDDHPDSLCYGDKSYYLCNISGGRTYLKYSINSQFETIDNNDASLSLLRRKNE